MPRETPPLTLLKARPLLSSLYRSDRIHLTQTKDALCLCYFNSEPVARFSGNDWEDVLAQATKDSFKEKK